jgi:hypothetical protein
MITSEVPKAPPEHAIEHVKGHGLRRDRVAAHAVEHPSKPGAGAKKP